MPRQSSSQPCLPGSGGNATRHKPGGRMLGGRLRPPAPPLTQGELAERFPLAGLSKRRSPPLQPPHPQQRLRDLNQFCSCQIRVLTSQTWALSGDPTPTRKSSPAQSCRLRPPPGLWDPGCWVPELRVLGPWVLGPWVLGPWAPGSGTLGSGCFVLGPGVPPPRGLL